MSTTLKEWLQQKIADMEATRDEIPFGMDEDDSNTLAAMKLALASLEAEAVAFRSKLKPPYAGSERWDYTDHRQPDAFELENCFIERLYTAPPAPVSVPEWTNEQCLEFLSVAFRHAEIKGDLELDDIRQGMKMVNGSRAAMLQGAEPVSQPCTLPDGYCVMPLKLTSENGAKGALSGEFHVTNRIVCQSCAGEGCEDCNDEGGWDAEIPVSWDTIKRIHEAAVEACSLPAAPQQEVK